MRKKNATDLLRFYGGDIREKTEDTIQKTEGGKLHSSQGIQLARKMVNYLSEDEGSAECFPFEIIDVTTVGSDPIKKK